MPKSPAYQRIKSAILTSIHQGIWVVGQAIPTEMALAEQFGVSRMTVNRALKELTDEQVLVRVQGSGTFVAQKQFHHTFIEIRNIAKDITSSGRAYRAEVLQKKSLDIHTLPKNIATHFYTNLSSETLAKTALSDNDYRVIFMVCIVHFADNEPLQLEERWVLGTLIPSFIDQDFSQINTSEYLINNLPLQGGDYAIKAVMPPKNIAHILKMNTNEPALLLTRKTISQNLVATVVNMWHAGNRHRFWGQL